MTIASISLVNDYKILEGISGYRRSWWINNSGFFKNPKNITLYEEVQYWGIRMEQQVQQMFSFSGIGILGLGFLIAIVLLVLGLIEKTDYSKRVRMIRAGGILLGLMVISAGLTWYGYLAVSSSVLLTFGDVIVLTLVSSIGGLISGVSCYISIRQ